MDRVDREKQIVSILAAAVSKPALTTGLRKELRDLLVHIFTDVCWRETYWNTIRNPDLQLPAHSEYPLELEWMLDLDEPDHARFLQRITQLGVVSLSDFELIRSLLRPLMCQQIADLIRQEPLWQERMPTLDQILQRSKHKSPSAVLSGV